MKKEGKVCPVYRLGVLILYFVRVFIEEHKTERFLCPPTPSDTRPEVSARPSPYPPAPTQNIRLGDRHGDSTRPTHEIRKDRLLCRPRFRTSDFYRTPVPSMVVKSRRPQISRAAPSTVYCGQVLFLPPNIGISAVSHSYITETLFVFDTTRPYGSSICRGPLSIHLTLYWSKHEIFPTTNVSTTLRKNKLFHFV